MSLTGQKLCERLGAHEGYIRKATKKAADAGKARFTCKGETFTFRKVEAIGGRGWAYSYTPVAEVVSTLPKRRKSSAAINPASIPAIDNLNKPTVAEKQALVCFCNTSNNPVRIIAQALLMHYPDTSIKESSLQTKLKRWVKQFKTKGINGLADKRGGKEFKADLDMVERALITAGSGHTTTAFLHYCYEYCNAHGLPNSLKNPTSNISSSAFYRAADHLLKTKPMLKEFMRIGMDSYTYTEPSFGREWSYANQQWEVDATPLDIMVKVPHLNGIRDFTNKSASEDYHLVRPQLIGVIDNFSGATIYGLYQSSNSYSNARLLYKAFGKLGKPETIKGDNGADYISEHLQGVIAALGIDYIATGKARGDEKGKIERSFRTLQHSAEFESLAGFVGHNVTERQMLEAQSSTKLEKLSGVATNIKGDYLWWWEMDNWIDNYTEHKQADRYAKHIPASAEEMQAIYQCLGKRHSKKVSKEGVRHQNSHYLSLDMWQHVQIGDQVDVIEHIDNANTLYLYVNNTFVCEISEKREYREGLTVEQIAANKKAYKQRVVKDVKSTTKKAQRNYKGLQNAMRDEFLDIETAQAEIKKEFEHKAEDNGFDSIAELRKLAEIAGAS